MAHFYEPKAQQPFLRIPGAVTALVLALVGAHALRQLVFRDETAQLLYRFGFVPARYSASFLAEHFINAGNIFERSIPFVSYMFLHVDWTHLIINCVWLVPFGAMVTQRYGSFPFLLFFVICGVLGAAFHLAVNWGSTSPVIGASAAVSGLMAASFRLLPDGPQAPLQPIWSKRVLLLSIVWICINAVAGITGIGTGPGVHMVAWEAHMGGYFAGLLLAGPFDRLFWNPRPMPDLAR